MEFAYESLRDAWKESVELLADNHLETGIFESFDFNPEPEKYFALEDQDIAHLFTARKDGVLVGYTVFFILPHMHYPDKIFAMQDVLYMTPSCRGISSVKFIKWVDEELRKTGVNVVLRHVTPKVDYSRVLNKFGYEELETSFIRTLH